MRPKHRQVDPGWINRRFRELERMIRESNAAKRLQAATIGLGGITVKDGGGVTIEDGGRVVVNGGGGVTVNDQGDIVVKGGGSIIVEGGGDVVINDGGDLRILDNAGIAVFTASDGPIKTKTRQDDNDSTTFPDGVVTEFLVNNVTIPSGYTKALVHLFVSAGATFTGAGNVGVLPQVEDQLGTDISNGTSGGPVSVSSTQAVEVDVTGQASVRLSVWAVRNGPVDAGSCNVHLSAAVIFTRT